MKINRLKYVREYNGYTQQEIASFLEIKQQSYFAFENEKIIPLKKLYKLSKFYNVNIDYLIGLSNKKIKTIYNGDLNAKAIGIKIKSFREKIHLSQRQLAKELNISNSTLIGYENGKVIIKTLVVYNLCNKYNLSLDWLLDKTKEYKLKKD